MDNQVKGCTGLESRGFLETTDGKIELICTDLTIQPDNCNFSCDYCLSNEMPDWKKGTQIKNNRSYKEDTDYRNSLHKFTDHFNSMIDIAILRISGGEVLRIDGIVDFFQREYRHYTGIRGNMFFNLHIQCNKISGL